MRHLKLTVWFVSLLIILLLLFGVTPAGAAQGPVDRSMPWGNMSRGLALSSLAHATTSTKPGWTVPAKGCPTWKVVGSPNPGVGANELLAVAAASSRNIWATGYYTTHPGGSPLPLAMRWNGHQWHTAAVPMPQGATASVLLGVAHIPQSDQFWSVGYWRGTGSNFYTLIERWNGTAWNIVPSPNGVMDTSLASVTALSENDAWAVGVYLDKQYTFHPIVERWNGTRWRIVPSPTPPTSLGGELAGVTVFADGTAVAVGDSYNGSLAGTALIERWNGTKWSIVVDTNPPGAIASDLYGISGSSPGNIWAVGDYQDVNSNVFTLTEQWNGSAWRVVASPNGSGDIANVLQGVVTSSAKNAWAVGFDTSPGGNQATLIEQWNGVKWSLVPSPNSSQPNNILQAVAAMPHSSHVVSVGLAIDNNLNSVTLTEMC